MSCFLLLNLSEWKPTAQRELRFCARADESPYAFTFLIIDNVDREDKSYAEYRMMMTAAENAAVPDFPIESDEEKKAYALAETRKSVRLYKDDPLVTVE